MDNHILKLFRLSTFIKRLSNITGFALDASTNRLFIILMACFALIVLLGSFARDVDHLHIVAQDTYKTVGSVGGIMIIVAFTRLLIYKRDVDVFQAMISIFKLVVWLSVALLFIRIFGSELTSLIVMTKANPERALAILSGFIIVKWLYDLIAWPAREYIRPGKAHVIGYHAAIEPVVPVARQTADIHRTAVHEAGHILLYACLPALPQSLSATILTEITPDDIYRGHVVHSPEIIPTVKTESFLRWSMLLWLAGSEAEFIMLGERGDGAHQDNQRWLHDAHQYLSAGFGEVFYANPIDDSQIAHNRAVLNSLKETHKSELLTYLTANKKLLTTLTNELEQRKSLDRGEIEAFLAQVVNGGEMCVTPGAIQTN